MTPPLESQSTEILIERNKFRAFVEMVAWGSPAVKVPGALREAARKLLQEHPGDDPDNYGDKR